MENIEDKPLTTGQKIYEIRHFMRITQVELGKLIGVKQTRVSKWERDTATPRLDYLKALAALATKYQVNVKFLDE